jgi:hypothetical protein
MKYLKLDKYIVSVENIHGVLNNVVPGSKKGQIIITYCDSISACLDFDSLEIAVTCFDKIAEAMGAS